MISEQVRYRGALLGLACGDAVGTTVEFCPRGSFAPLTDMVGGGPFDLPVGAWTDDCSMALCLAESLVHRRGFNAKDQMNRYSNWSEYGYLSSIGHCFDIGGTVAAALERYAMYGDPFAGSTHPQTAGNGSIMRLVPVPMFYLLQPDVLGHYAAESARTTHAAEEALDCTALFAHHLKMALTGADKRAIVVGHGYSAVTAKGALLAAGGWMDKTEAEICGSGYVVVSLEAALWCFWHTDTYESAVLKAANLGDDADTTAAIVGQLAGAFYGVDAIPPHWLERLIMRDEIQLLADQLLQQRLLPGEVSPV